MKHDMLVWLKDLYIDSRVIITISINIIILIGTMYNSDLFKL